MALEVCPLYPYGVTTLYPYGVTTLCPYGVRSTATVSHVSQGVRIVPTIPRGRYNCTNCSTRAFNYAPLPPNLTRQNCTHYPHVLCFKEPSIIHSPAAAPFYRCKPRYNCCQEHVLILDVRVVYLVDDTVRRSPDLYSVHDILFINTSLMIITGAVRHSTPYLSILDTGDGYWQYWCSQCNQAFQALSETCVSVTDGCITGINRNTIQDRYRTDTVQDSMWSLLIYQ